MAVLRIKNKETNKWEDVITIKGDKGDMPTHEVDGTKIRFQNPDGSWGDWIELEVVTAENIPTSDGSNVQMKLDNSFSLGSAPDGNSYVQKKSTGMIDLLNGDADELIYAGDYFIYGTEQKGTPTVNGWYINVLVGDTNDFCTQVATVSSEYMTFRRTRVNGVFGYWKLIDGEVSLWTGSQSSGTLLLSQAIQRFGMFKVYIGTTTVLIGAQCEAGVIRTSCTDTHNTTQTIINSAIFTFTDWSSRSLTIARVFTTTLSASGHSTAVPLITKIVGLP